MFRLSPLGGVCLVWLVCLAGCLSRSDSGRLRTVPVSGTVTYKGSLVAGATVTFSPASEKGYAAVGTTDAQGRFTLRSPGGGEGAVPGSYKVTVFKTEGQSGAGDVQQAKIDAGEAPKLVEHLPVKYKSTETTTLTAEVQAGEKNEFKFELSD